MIIAKFIIFYTVSILCYGMGHHDGEGSNCKGLMVLVVLNIIAITWMIATAWAKNGFIDLG